MPDKTPSSAAGGRQAILASVLVLVILSPIGYSVVRGVIAEDAEPFLEPPDTKQGTCIWNMSAEEMRIHHWEHLRRIRENVVRYGNRTEEGLGKCKDCHTYRDQFCTRCHQAVSLTPDCFDCHYYPTSDQAAPTPDHPAKTTSPSG